jgi:8-oxo-dGTP pyrophosphatase MutT (NUDIX family)
MEAVTQVEIRNAARAVVLDPDDRILLVRWVNEDNGVDTWLTPGGGIEDGEDDAAALRREVREETGLESFEAGPTIWTRRHSFPWYERTVDQRETFHRRRGRPRGPLVDAGGARGIGRNVRPARPRRAPARAARARSTS